MHEQKFLKCEICEKTFQVPRNLKRRHVDTVHVGKKPYECKTCGMSFGQKGHVVYMPSGGHQEVAQDTSSAVHAVPGIVVDEKG